LDLMLLQFANQLPRLVKLALLKLLQ